MCGIVSYVPTDFGYTSRRQPASSPENKNHSTSYWHSRTKNKHLRPYVSQIVHAEYEKERTIPPLFFFYPNQKPPTPAKPHCKVKPCKQDAFQDSILELQARQKEVIYNV